MENHIFRENMSLVKTVLLVVTIYDILPVVCTAVLVHIIALSTGFVVLKNTFEKFTAVSFPKGPTYMYIFYYRSALFSDMRYSIFTIL